LFRRGFTGGCLLALVLGACATPPVYLASDFQSARRVAVLPMANNTNDLDGPVYVRKLIFEQLSARGYQLIPLDQIDTKLRDNGFTDGGQLKMATPEQIGQWVGADTLLYGTLENFDYFLLGVYFQRRVKVGGKLVDAQSGERLWETEQGYSTRQIATTKRDIERLSAIELAAKSIEKMAHIPLQVESRAAVTLLLHTLPQRP
jgi:hypothetical protein